MKSKMRYKYLGSIPALFYVFFMLMCNSDVAHSADNPGGLSIGSFFKTIMAEQVENGFGGDFTPAQADNDTDHDDMDTDHDDMDTDHDDNDTDHDDGDEDHDDGDEDHDDGDENPCIASYLLGDDDPRLETLRSFRDNVLSSTPAGEAIVTLFYTGGEKIIKICERHPIVKNVSKSIIVALIPAVKVMVRDLQ